MINFLKSKAALYLVIGILLFCLYSIKREIKKPETSGPVNTEAKIIKQYQDSDQRNHVLIERKANEITQRQIAEEKRPTIIDTAAKALNVAKEKLDQITKAYFTIEKQYLTAKTILDSLGVAGYEYRDKNIWIIWKPGASHQSTGGYFSYKYYGAINVVDYTRENKFLGLKLGTKYYTDLYFDDPNAYINGVERVTIRKYDQPKLVKFNIASQYDVSNKSLMYGVGLQLEKGLLEIGASQLYNQETKNWNTLINANLTIKGF